MKPSKLWLVAACAAVVACSGGGSGTVAGIDGGGAFPPVATTIASQGSITGFGSIIVNGVRFDTSGASFSIDGEPGSESDLSVGQVVTVFGTINDDGLTGAAESVFFDEIVEGPVESIDLAARSLVVLGQTVITNDDTSYEVEIMPRSLEGLDVGDVVEISGFRNSTGNAVATRIELEDGIGTFETTGIASNVDTAAMTFDIGGLSIDYSGAMLEDFPTGAPENGQLIEAEGQSLGASGELVATEVEFKGNDFDVEDADEVEIEGLVTRFVSAADFDVNGVPVTTVGTTVYENGSAADLGLDRKIEVEGEFDAAGVLVADEVEFKLAGTIRIGGLVEDVQGSQVTLLGIDVGTDSSTEFEDDSALDLQNFDVSDVNVGDYLEVRAYDDNGTPRATRVERDDDPGEVFIRGPVDSVNAPELTILGVTVVTSTQTEFRDEDIPVSAAEFFARAPGSIVEADGILQNGEIIADEVEIED